MSRENNREPQGPMEPLADSQAWVSTDTGCLEGDAAEEAILAVRIGAALNCLVVHMDLERLEDGRPPTSIVEMRRFLVSMTTTGAYVREAINILTGSKGVAGPRDSKRVMQWAANGGASEELQKTIRHLMAGAHPASTALVRLRNSLVFHWDADVIRPVVEQYRTRETLIWAEGVTDAQKDLVYRFSVEAIANAILRDGPSYESVEDELKALSDTVGHITAAAVALVEHFNLALAGYLHSINGQVVRRESPKMPEVGDAS